MLTYSTEFPIDPKKSTEEVLSLARDWIVGSPHSKIKSGDLTLPKSDSEEQVQIGDEKVVWALTGGPDFTMGGLQYLRVERKPVACEWRTSIVAHRSSERHFLSVQVSCESVGAVTRLPSARKPYFVRQALKKLGAGMDGSIPVTDQPFILGENEANITAAIINGIADNRLPVVYVSAAYDNSHIIDPHQLAKWVSGQAHVFVEPSRSFSSQLRDMTGSRNPYGGSVAVYWPESNARKSYFLDSERPTNEAVQLSISRDIQSALANRRPTSSCTWPHLKEVLSRAKLDSLKAAGSIELNDYVTAFDEDIKAKGERLEAAEQEIARLNAELKRYAVNHQSRSSGLLTSGKEQNFHDGEIRDIVINALIEAHNLAPEDSRRAHILRDLIEHNPLVKQGDNLATEIRSIFKGYVSMNAKVKGALTALGFDLTDDGKHHKAVYHGDGRYTFTISKTSSDFRAGLNTASDINKKLF